MKPAMLGGRPCPYRKDSVEEKRDKGREQIDSQV